MNELLFNLLKQSAMKTNVKMNCKNCGAENLVELDQLLVKNFEQSIRVQLQTELFKRESELNQQKEEYKLLSEQLSKEKEDVDQLVNSRVKSMVQSREEALKESIRKEINEEKTNQLQELENELVKKSVQLREL